MSAQRPKKIVIIRNAFSYDFGGGERMPVNLAKDLQDNGFLAVVVSRSSKLLAYAEAIGVSAVKGWWWPRQNWSGFRIILTPVYLGWQVLLSFWYLALFTKLRPDIIHAQSKDDFISATIAGILLGKKVIWSDHADLKYIYLNNHIWYKNPVGKLVSFCSQGARAVILTSWNDKRQIEQAYGQSLNKKYRVIYNGISDRPDLLAKTHSGNKIIFASTSRLVSDKGIAELIEAFKDLQLNIPAELWLFGEGPEEDKFKTLAAGQPAIKFMGFTNDVPSRLAAADVFVHPSYMEGFSLSLVEAAMLGKPIIACDVGGNPELIENGKNGLLIPPKDAKALAEAMKRLADDSKLRRRIGDAARDTFQKNFVFEKIVKDQYIPLYEEI